MHNIKTIRNLLNPRTGYYTYVLYKPCLTPFYIGEGKGMRVLSHFKSSNYENVYKRRTIDKYRDDIKIAISFCDSKEEARELQDFMILEVGIENLTNHIHPDEDGSGQLHSDESKKKISKARKGRYTGEDNPNYGKKHTLESRKKMSEANIGNTIWKGRKHSPEAKEKQRLAAIGNTKWLGKTHTQETKDKISKGNKGKYTGKSNPSAKLTEADVEGILYLAHFTNTKRQVIWELFNISKGQFERIKAGTSWKHVTI